MSDTGTTTPTGLSAIQEKMLSAGFAVTLTCGTLVHPKTKPQANNAQPKANKPAAKTAPAKQTAWEAKQAQWAKTKTARATMAAHKKAGNLPRYVDGELYSFETARKLKMVTAKGNPTKAFAAKHKAGNKQTTVRYTEADLTVTELQEMERLMQKYGVTIA